MKVYSSPIDPPEIDYANYDRDTVEKNEEEHMVAVKDWLLAHGYTGKLTGEVIRFPVADGYALYMMADGRKSALIHLPYCDAYQYPDVRFLPKAEIVRRLNADKAFERIFAKRGKK